uniref:Uncharacterized protein n=1 Tax=Amphimedon queenslandica TaxID=400682 RepID=A0A1X7V8G8_AMPQE
MKKFTRNPGTSPSVLKIMAKLAFGQLFPVI